MKVQRSLSISLLATVALALPVVAADYEVQEYPLPGSTHPHDVAPAADGGIWYTGQWDGTLGWLDPDTGEIVAIQLGAGARPHGVIVGPEGRPWITDGGLNAIVTVDPETMDVTVFPLPQEYPDTNLNTATFDHDGVLWFTGQNGIYGRLDPMLGEVEVFDAPGGRGPYGIATCPNGDVYYASLAGSHIARIVQETAEATQLWPPTQGQGARRVWCDSIDRVWIAEWDAGQVAVYDSSDESWREWPLPGDGPRAYAVYVDEHDAVWLTDFGANAVVRFDPVSETFESFPMPDEGSTIRQLLGRPGEVWGAESGLDRIVVMRELTD